MINFRRITRLAADTRGVSAIEFAFVAAFLILPLTLGVYDFGTALYYKLQVGNAARAGAQYVNVNGYSSTYNTATLACSNSNFTCAVQAATPLGSKITVSAAAPYCGCQSGAQYSAAGFSPPCNVCSAGNSTGCCPAGQTPVTLTHVNASYNYAPIFNYFGFGPSNGFDLTASITAMIY